MASMKMEKLVELEGKHGLVPGELTYQQRVSRISAIEKGLPWEEVKKEEVRKGTVTSIRKHTPTSAVSQHPLFGVKLLITPLMVADKNRALFFDEPIGHEINVKEMAAGEMLYGANEDVDRMVGDYKIVSENKARIVTAKTTLPKSGQEITYTIGEDLVPVVRGNDGMTGYIWSYPTHLRQVGDTMIQIYGLQTLIQSIAPELLSKFKGKPVMSYIDGNVLVASIPQTKAILKEYRRRELQDAKLGLG